MIRIQILAICILFTFAIGCNSGKNDQSSHEKHDIEMASDETSDESENSHPSDIATAYLKLKDALVKSDATLTQIAANELEIAFHSSNLLSEAELAERISQEDDIEGQRKIFKVLSEQIYKLASENKFEFTTLYKQYCPMAFDNTGAYWLSDTKEIFNPYFGDKMLRCGKTEETLAKK